MHTEKYILKTLKSIAFAVFNGKMSGKNPDWEIELVDVEEKNLSISSYYHLAKCILRSNREGEIVEEQDDDNIFIGWWKLTINWTQQIRLYVFFEDNEIKQIITEFERGQLLFL